jgi:hypothetical protein
MLLIQPDFIPLGTCEEFIDAFNMVSDTAQPESDLVRYMGVRTEVGCRMFSGISNTSLLIRLRELRKNVVRRILEYYGDDRSCQLDWTVMIEMREGDYLPLHADSEQQDSNGDWIENHTPWRIYSALIYLNTCNRDYSGGEIVFPNLAQEVVPQAGLMLAFKCGRLYEHFVRPVQHGKRYAISMWMTDDPQHWEQW